MSDTAQQLRLFEPPQPLVERLGADFFRAIPRAAGVYQMHDAAGVLVYVGKAGDLRARLNSYRRTRNQSRKTVRLIHTAATIRWEVCPSEAEARLRENELLRLHRPRFNKAGTWPLGEYLHSVSSSPTELHLRLDRTPAPGCQGAFRSSVRWTLGCLGQLIWLKEQGWPNPATLPFSLSAQPAPRELRLTGSTAETWRTPLMDYFRGYSEELIDRLKPAQFTSDQAFARAFHTASMQCLEDFFVRGPQRNRWLRQRFPSERTWIEPTELDDLPIRSEVRPST